MEILVYLFNRLSIMTHIDSFHLWSLLKQNHSLFLSYEILDMSHLTCHDKKI